MASSQNCLSEINKAFNSIRKPESSMTTLLGLMKLVEILKESDECTRNTFCSKMVSLNLAKLSKQYLCEVKSGKHSMYVLLLLHNISYISNKFCESIVESGTHELIVSNIENNSTFGVENLNKSPKQENAHEIMFSLLSIINNILRNYPECRTEFRASKLKYALKKLLSVEDPLMKSCALMCLVYAVNVDEDQKLITLGKTHVEFLARRILPATPHIKFMKTSDEADRFMSGSGSLGFSTEEILEPFSILSTNSQTSLELVKQGIISICQSVLIKANQTHQSYKNKSLTSATKWALLILYRLSKRAVTAPLIDFKELIHKFSDHPIDDIAEIANGILAAINDSERKNNEKQDESDGSKTETLSSDLQNVSFSRNDDDTDNDEIPAPVEDENLTQIKVEAVDDSDKSSKDHIMISYCHQQKDIADRLLKELRKNGVKELWIDQEHLHKDSGTVQGMVRAVDNAKSVICCISEAYSKSANCMGELVYATNKMKNLIPVVVEKNFSPDGELLFYLKDSFRFNISTEDLFRTNCQMLLQKLAADDEK